MRLAMVEGEEGELESKLVEKILKDCLKYGLIHTLRRKWKQQMTEGEYAGIWYSRIKSGIEGIQ